MRSVPGAIRVVCHARWQYVGGQSTPGDGDVAFRTPHAILTVLVRTRQSAAGAVGWTKWASQFYTFKGRDICVLSGPRTDAAVQALTDPATDVLHARLPCPAPRQWAVQLQKCHEDHLHLPHTGVGPNQLDHLWFTGLRDVFRPQLPWSAYSPSNTPDAPKESQQTH